MSESEKAIQFIDKNIGFYNKINVINLSREFPSDCLERIDYKYITLIQEHIQPDQQTIVISPYENHKIILFMNLNSYNYTTITDKSPEFIECIFKYCNGTFIGFTSDDNSSIRANKVLIDENNITKHASVIDATPSVYGLYFVCCYENYIDVIKEQLSILVISGLYKKTKQLFIFICMFNKENAANLIKLFSYFDPDKKITLITTDQNLYEKFAINIYKKYIDDSSPYYFYYFHTKAVSRNKDNRFSTIRKILNFYTLSKPEININLLNYYDVVGCSLSVYPKLHFSGNFWWAKSDYTAKLVEPIRNTYLAPEMYICSGKEGNFISLCQTTNDSKLSEHVNKSYEIIASELTTVPIYNEECKYTVC
jgi:hypothetical protein